MQPIREQSSSFQRSIPSNQSALLSSGERSSFDDVWPTIEPMVKRIFSEDSLTKSEWQDIFWKVHITCIWDYNSAIRLQQKLIEVFTVYINKEQEYIFSNSQNDLTLLKAYMCAWKRFMFFYTYVPMPFAPLEKFFHKTSLIVGGPKKRNEIENYIRLTMVEMWVLNIFSQANSRLIHGAMMLIENERNNTVSDPQSSSLISGVKDSCLYLCNYLQDKLFIYRNNFERIYVLTTESFYQTKGQQYYAQNGALSYMKWVDLKLKEETERANRYLESHSLSKVISACVKNLIGQYKEIFAEKFVTLLKNNDISYCNLMFTLLDRVENGIEPLLNHFKEYLINTGIDNLKMEVLSIAQDSEKFIEHLLKLFNMATDIISQAFNSDPRFLTTRDMAFNMLINDKSVFILALTFKSNGSQQITNNNSSVDGENNNRDLLDNNNSINDASKHLFESRCAELFANYCDMLLRKTNLSRHLTSEQIEAKLKHVIVLLKYVQDKDMFMKFYKVHLTRRLILDASADSDKEELMVNWLREVGMPADFVNKLSRMFQDLKVSEDFNQQFKEAYSDTSFCDMIYVKILNSSAWSRNYEKVNVTLPPEIEEIMPKIESYYKNQHNGRNLLWHHQFSSGVITYNSDNGSYDLDATSYHISVLFCWNDRPNDSINFEALSLASQLPNVELRRTLWSLVANPKLKSQILLVDSSPTPVKHFKDFRDCTSFKLNTKFALLTKAGKMMKRGRFNLIGRLQLQTEKSREEEAESIFRLRTLRAQEAIMKIMKTRKSMTYASLHIELTNVLKQMFIPSKALIKEQLEWLIEHEYITRDPADNNLFYYSQ